MHLEDLSVVVPAYREERRIASTVRSLVEHLARRPGRYEVIVVDDGSPDGTSSAVRALGLEGVRVVVRPERGGKGAAVRTGVASAAGDWILVVDADGSIPIRELDRLVPHGATHPIVIGSKWAPGSSGDFPRKRRILSSIARVLVGLLAVRGFRDTQCGFKLYRASVARELFAHQRLMGYGYDFEILYLACRLGHPVAEVPIHVDHQQGSSVQLASYGWTFLELLALARNRLLGRYPRP